MSIHVKQYLGVCSTHKNLRNNAWLVQGFAHEHQKMSEEHGDDHSHNKDGESLHQGVLGTP